MKIYLDDYRKQRAPEPHASRRDEGLSRVIWNTAFGVAALSRYRTPQELSPPLPDHFESVDMRAFMERVRALASQI